MTIDLRGIEGEANILDDYGVLVRSDGPYDIVPGVTTDLGPMISGGQFATDTQTATYGVLENVTGQQWLTSADGSSFTPVEGETGTTWELPASGSPLWYRLDVDGDLDGVTATYSSPIKYQYLEMDANNYPLYDMDEHMHHDMMDNAALDLCPHEDATLVFTGSGSPMTAGNWDINRVPEAGDRILIPYGKTVTWDYATCPRLDWIRVDGTFLTDTTKNVHLFAETWLITRGGLRRIGASKAAYLPRTSSFTFEVSTRDWRTSPTATSNMDVVRDPQLLGRGFLCQGTDEVFGAPILPFAWTKLGTTTNVNHLPVETDTTITTEGTLTEWEDNDNFAIPATAYAPQTTHLLGRMTEYKTATISGNILTLDSALVHHHDEWEWATQHPTALRDKDKNQLPIVNMERNVIHKTEGGSEASTSHQRGHNMWMHSYASFNIRYMKALNMGRSDKENFGAKITSSGLVRANSKDTSTTDPTYDATANIIGRYPFHGHQNAYYQGAEDRNNWTGCLVDGSPNHAFVLHDNDADIVSCVGCKTAATAVIWEVGREQGWSLNNFMFDFRKTRIREGNTGNNLNAGLKAAQKEAGDYIGDNFVYPAGYGVAGRAIVMEDNGASGCQFVIAQSNREQSRPGFIQDIYSDVPIALSSFGHLTQIGSGHHTTMDNAHVPIFMKGTYGIGAGIVVSVLKSSGVNEHSFQSIIDSSWGYGIHHGHNFNYLGIYLSLAPRFVGAGFRSNHPGNNLGNVDNNDTTRVGIGSSRTEAVRDIGADIQGFDYRIENAGGDPLVQATNDMFSKTNPRFVTADNTDISGNGTDTAVENVRLVTNNKNGSTTTTPDVTVDGASNGTQELQMLARGGTFPSPFVIGEFGAGNVQYLDPTEDVYVAKKDAFNLITEPAAIALFSLHPYEDAAEVWDYKGFAGIRGGYSASSVRLYGEEFGYWKYDDGGGLENYIIFWQYDSEVLGDRFMITARAIRIHADYTQISGWTNNGTITYSGIIPTASDVAISVARGGETTTNILTASSATTAAPGATLALMDREFRPPQRCTIEINAGTGEATVYAFDDVPAGTDTAQVTITDGQYGYRTIKLNITVT